MSHDPDDLVSIKTICKRLDITRSTFYANFRGKGAKYHVPERTIGDSIVRYRWGEIMAAIYHGEHIQTREILVSALDGERRAEKAQSRKRTKVSGNNGQESKGGAAA